MQLAGTIHRGQDASVGGLAPSSHALGVYLGFLQGGNFPNLGQYWKTLKDFSKQTLKFHQIFATFSTLVEKLGFFECKLTLRFIPLTFIHAK
jgi:hypothetical protein